MEKLIIATEGPALEWVHQHYPEWVAARRVAWALPHDVHGHDVIDTLAADVRVAARAGRYRLLLYGAGHYVPHPEDPAAAGAHLVEYRAHPVPASQSVLTSEERHFYHAVYAAVYAELTASEMEVGGKASAAAFAAQAAAEGVLAAREAGVGDSDVAAMLREALNA